MSGGIVFPIPAGLYWWSGQYGELRASGPHGGTDLAAALGTPLYAQISGRIDVPAFEAGGAGLNVWITDGSTRWKDFHLSALLVRQGEWVTAGQLVGRVGTSGRSSGPHLHTELWRFVGGVWARQNPTPHLLEAQSARRFPGMAAAAPPPPPPIEELTMAEVERIMTKLGELANNDLLLAVRVYRRVDETHAEAGRWMSELTANMTRITTEAVAQVVGQLAGGTLPAATPDQLAHLVEEAVTNALASVQMRSTFDPAPTAIAGEFYPPAE